MIPAGIQTRGARMRARFAAGRFAAAGPRGADNVVPVLATTEQLRQRIVATLGRGKVRLCGGWDEYQRCAPESVCSIVAAPWLASDLLARMALLQDRFPGHRLVVVTSRDADNVRFLKSLVIDELLWIEEIERTLRRAIEVARTESVLQEIAGQLQQSGLRPRLRQALAAACVAREPIRTVAELGRAVGRDPRALWRWWPVRCDHEALTPKAFLDWVLILRAAELKVPGRSWAAVADRLGVHEDTIARAARRRSRLTLRELDAGGPALVLPRIATVLDTLLAQTRDGVSAAE